MGDELTSECLTRISPVTKEALRWRGLRSQPRPRSPRHNLERILHILDAIGRLRDCDGTLPAGL